MSDVFPEPLVKVCLLDQSFCPISMEYRISVLIVSISVESNLYHCPTKVWQPVLTAQHSESLSQIPSLLPSTARSP